MEFSIEQFREMVKEKPKRHKYNAKKTVVNGITFDSGAEAERYQELGFMKLSGVIKDFELQPVFKLPGKTKYIADFKVIYPDGKVVIEDTKGFETQAFRIKKRLFKESSPELELRIIKKKARKGK